MPEDSSLPQNDSPDAIPRQFHLPEKRRSESHRVVPGGDVEIHTLLPRLLVTSGLDLKTEAVELLIIYHIEALGNHLRFQLLRLEQGEDRVCCPGV